MYLPLLNEVPNATALQIAIGLSGLICLWASTTLLRQHNRKMHKVKTLQKRIQTLRKDTLLSLKQNQRPAGVGFMRSAAIKLNLLEPAQRDTTEMLLSEAGIYSRDAVYVLAFSQFILPTLLGLLAFISVFRFHPPATQAAQFFNYACAVLAAYIGTKLPVWWLRHMRKERYHRIRKSLPDMLDLMTISVEAGLSLAVAMENVSREMASSHPELADELKITAAEGNLLSDRHKALANWGERCKIQEVRSIVNVLTQTEKFGTPVVQALQALAVDFRQTRMLVAEQRAIRLPVIMTIPMMLCIMPTIFIIILSPAVMKLLDTLHHH